MWCGVVWCGVVWCGAVWYGVIRYGVVQCGVVWCSAVGSCLPTLRRSERNICFGRKLSLTAWYHSFNCMSLSLLEVRRYP